MKKIGQVLLVMFFSLTLGGCSNAAEKAGIGKKAIQKGAQQGMKTYYMGRFAIDVPAEFKLAVQSQKIRYADVSDFIWQSGDRGNERKTLWANKIAEIKKLPLPVDKKETIIEEVEFPAIGKWAKGVIYYGDYLIPKRMFWTILVDYGQTGAWLTIAGTNKEMMVKNFTNILSSYEFGQRQFLKNYYFTRYGAVALPYLEQEKTYARFDGPMGMQLKIEMHEIHKAPEKEGIIDRTVAAMSTGFAAGLDIKKIRSQKRTAAGLSGEEEILQGDDGKRKNVSFDWEYLGRVDSGEQPMIQISIDTMADNLEEKIRIWDKVLDSFRPAYQ